MTIQKNAEGKIELSYGTLFLMSFGATFLTILLFGKESMSDVGMFDRSALQAIDIEATNNSKLFLYVLGERFLILPIWFLLSTTHLAKLTGYTALIWYGAGMGITIGTIFLKYGMGAFLILLAASIPHYLLFIPIFMLTLKINRNKRVVNRKFYVQLIVLEILVLIGCLLESYVNPKVLKKILEFL